MYCFFANPHNHHSYFTALALSQSYPVLLLCPPLQIQLFCRKWSKKNLRLKTPSIKEFSVQMLALMSFILYKLSLMNESQYLSVIIESAKIILASKNAYIFVHYQDYIRIPAEVCKHVSLDICEIIISLGHNSSNQKTTYEAASSADIVVCPNTSMAEMFQKSGKARVIAPYGGDKSIYRQTSRRAAFPSSINDTEFKKSFLICARANTNRKGLDILLDSLLLLSKKLKYKSTPFIDVRICGSVAPGEDETMLKHTIKVLGKHSTISITAAQYTQNDYNSLLRASDFFVMPSRLESTSLAALEALWHGVPCILSKECGVDAFVDGRHGFLLDSLADTCLAEALYEIIDKSDLACSVRKNLAKDRDLFKWNNYLNAYKNILSCSSLSD